MDPDADPAQSRGPNRAPSRALSEAAPPADIPQAAREAVATLLAPAEDAEAPLRAAWIESPMGTLLAVADEAGLRLLEFGERSILSAELARLRREIGAAVFAPHPTLAETDAALAAYFEDGGRDFDLPLAPLGTDFQLSVWQALREIPTGETCAYGDIARRIGKPGSVRAVGAANGANPIAIVVPCHRVIGSDGSLTGYGGGLWRKRRLLAHESAARARREGALL